MGRRKVSSRSSLRRSVSYPFFEFLTKLWEDFWNPPEGTCPKCGHLHLEYYDSFLFNPIRTLANRRRLRCKACRFVWRRSRSGKHSMLGRFGQ